MIPIPRPNALFSGRTPRDVPRSFVANRHGELVETLCMPVSNIYTKTDHRDETVLLLNGWGCDMSYYLGLASALSHHYRVLMLNNPGVGVTPLGDISPSTYIDRCISNAIDVLPASTRHLHIVGHSMGGQIGILLADRIATERSQHVSVTSLSLIAPGFIGSPEDTMSRGVLTKLTSYILSYIDKLVKKHSDAITPVVERLTRLLTFATSAILKIRLHSTGVEVEGANSDFWNYLRASPVKNVATALFGNYRSGEAAKEAFRRLQLPVAIIQAKFDGIVSPHIGYRLHSLCSGVPSMKTIVIHDTSQGHFVHSEDHGVVAGALIHHIEYSIAAREAASNSVGSSHATIRIPTVFSAN